VRKLIPLCPPSKGEIMLDREFFAAFQCLPVYGQKSACIAYRAKKSNLIMACVPSFGGMTGVYAPDWERL